MTAIRVITNHEELENSGVVSHSELDEYVGSTQWVTLPPAPGEPAVPLPPNARTLRAGPGIVIIDQGPGGDIIITKAPPALGESMSWNEVPAGERDGINKTFVLQHAPYPTQAVMLFINGVKQRQGPDSDYTLSGDTVNILADYTEGSIIDVTYSY